MAESYFGMTDTGRQRDSNEDVFLLQQWGRGRYLLAAVIDGVGGYEGGEIAAALAKEALVDTLGNKESFSTDLLLKAVLAANERIFREKQEKEQYPHMSCVLSLIVVEKRSNRFYFAHVGDTRLYLLRDQTLVKLSTDHSFVGLLEDSGRISEKEAMDHPKRNEIDRALGFQPNIPQAEQYIQTGESPFLPGDLLLLCSDGLTDLVNRETITRILTGNESLRSKTAALVAAANEEGGKDNITVVLVQHTKNRTEYEAIEPRRVSGEADEVEVPVFVEEKQEPVPAKAKNNFNWWWLLVPAALLVLLMIYFGTRHNEGDETGPVNSSTPLYLGALALQDSLNKSKDTFYLDPKFYSDTLLLDDTVWIYKDSLHLRGSGRTVLIGGTLPATLQVAPTLKRLDLYSLELNNLPFRISSSAARNIYLHGVKLRNVELGISQPIRIRDTVFSGPLSNLLQAAQRRGGQR